MTAKDYSANMAPPIPLFLAATSGPRTIQKYTLNSWDLCITIRQLGASIMGPDVDLTRAEVSATIDGAEASVWTGTNLDFTVDFVVNTTKLLYVKCIFSLEDTLPARPEEPTSAFSAMMGDKRRFIQYPWPQHYPASNNKTLGVSRTGVTRATRVMPRMMNECMVDRMCIQASNRMHVTY